MSEWEGRALASSYLVLNILGDGARGTETVSVTSTKHLAQQLEIYLLSQNIFM